MLNHSPSSSEPFEKHLSPSAAKIYRSLITATRAHEQFALGVLAELSALGLKAQFEAALERAPALLVNAPAKDSSVLPSYWNFIHEIALRVFHPTANMLNDSQIAPLIGLAAINLKLFPNDSDSRIFMARFIVSFIEKIRVRHGEEGNLTAEQRSQFSKVPEEIVKEAVSDIGNVRAFAELLITDKADTSIFTRLDSAALAALSKGLFPECYHWEFLAHAGGDANLSAAEIQNLQQVLAQRIAEAKKPPMVTRQYLTTTLGLWVWGNSWERDRQILGADPRERLLQKRPKSSRVGFGEFLITSLPTVADFIDASFNDAKERSRYSGKVGEIRFRTDMKQRLDWITALRLSPATLLDSARTLSELNQSPSIGAAVIVAFCSREDATKSEMLVTASELLDAGLLPSKQEIASSMLSSGLLMDLARIGFNQAVQHALDTKEPKLSIASMIPAITISAYHAMHNETVEAAEAKSLISDLPASDMAQVEARLSEVAVTLGHQPKMLPLVKEVLRLFPDRPANMPSVRYMETMADVLRFAEVVVRRKNSSPLPNLDPTDPRCVAAPSSLIDCINIAHQWTKAFGAVYPTILGMVLTAAAGHDLRKLFPQYFSPELKSPPGLPEIVRELTDWRKNLVVLNSGSWPLVTTELRRQSKYGFGGFGINQELFSSAVGNQPPKFRFSLSNIMAAAAFKSGGLAFSPSLFLPDPMPLPYGLYEQETALDKAWPDASMNRYLIGHVKWMLIYTQPFKRRDDLTAGQCYLPATLSGAGVAGISVRRSNGAEISGEQLQQAYKLLSDLNPAITEDIKITNQQAFTIAKTSVIENIRLNIDRMSANLLFNPQIARNIGLLKDQVLELVRADTPQQLLAILAHTNFRLISDSSLAAFQVWLSTFVPEDARQNLSAQSTDIDGVRRGIVRLVAGVDSISHEFTNAINPQTVAERKAAEDLVDKVFFRKRLNATYKALEKTPIEERTKLYMHSSTGYELSIAGLVADTCAISEIDPQRKNANIACISFLQPLQALNQPIFVGNAVIFGVLLHDGSGSVLIRPLNPSEDLLEQHPAADIVEGLFNQIEAWVREIGRHGQHIRSITVPYEERSGGILSNRPDIVAYLNGAYFADKKNERTALMNPNAAVYRDVPIPGELVVVRRW